MTYRRSLSVGNQLFRTRFRLTSFSQILISTIKQFRIPSRFSTLHGLPGGRQFFLFSSFGLYHALVAHCSPVTTIVSIVSGRKASFPDLLDIIPWLRHRVCCPPVENRPRQRDVRSNGTGQSARVLGTGHETRATSRKGTSDPTDLSVSISKPASPIVFAVELKFRRPIGRTFESRQFLTNTFLTPWVRSLM